MALNFDKLARMAEFSLELQSLGAVRCLSLNTDHLSQAHKKLGLSGAQGLDIARWLFGEMARRPVEGRSDEDEEIEGACLGAEELSSVTDKELEEFANKLIQKNNYLLKTHKGGDIEKSADESACEFLVRAFRHHAAEQKAQTKPAFISQLTNVTTEAQYNFAQQSALGAIADANQFLTKNSAIAAMETEQKAQWERMTKPAFNSHFANVTAEIVQRNIAQQSALGEVADANQFLTKNSAIAAMEAEQKAQWERMTKPAFNSHFANVTMEAMQRNLALSNQFQDTIDKYTHGNLVTEAERIDAKVKDMPKVADGAFQANVAAEATQHSLGSSNQHQDAINKLTFDLSATKPIFSETMQGEPNNHLMPPHIPKNPIHETNEKLGNVVEQIEDLRPMAAQAAQLIRSMNDTALKMQADYIENASTAGRQTRFAIWIAAVSLLVSAVGLVISSFFSYQSYVDAKESGVKSDAQFKAFQNEIRDLVAVQREEQAAFVKAIGDARRVSPAAIKK